MELACDCYCTLGISRSTVRQYRTRQCTYSLLGLSPSNYRRFTRLHGFFAISVIIPTNNNQYSSNIYSYIVVAAPAVRQNHMPKIGNSAARDRMRMATTNVECGAEASRPLASLHDRKTKHAARKRRIAVCGRDRAQVAAASTRCATWRS